MSRHIEAECWIDREHFDSYALAADAIGISRAALAVLKRRGVFHCQVLDEFDHLRTVDFIYPGPIDHKEIAPPAPPPRTHHPGESLLRGHITHRLGAYR